MDATIPRETPEQKTERHDRAMALCRICPEMTACLAKRLADDSLGEGIWAGQLFGPPKNTTCRCGNPLKPGQTYCRRACKDKASGERRRKTVRHGVCYCGTRFTTKQPRQLYCSEACQKSRKRQPERVQRSEAA